jgi:hypothetical protein
MRGGLAFCRGVEQAIAAPGTTNYGPFDPFSFAHAGVGLLFGALGLGLGPMVFLAVGWEVLEHLLKDCIPGAFVHPSQDTLRNAAGDVAVTLVAWLLARAGRQWFGRVSAGQGRARDEAHPVAPPAPPRPAHTRSPAARWSAPTR